MARPLYEQMREAVEAKHKRALQALEELRDYLDEATPSANDHASLVRPAKQPPRKGTGKIRPAVLAAMKDRFRSVQEVAAETGFTKLQVRGVVLSPSLKDKFSKQPQSDGTVEYKYEGDSQK